MFEDECSLSNTATLNYKWSKKGEQPKIQQKQKKRERVTLFGAVNVITGVVIVQNKQKREIEKHLRNS